MTTYNQQPPKNPALAAILSLLINGLGQVYNGQIGKGILIFVVQLVNAALTFVVIGFVLLPIVWIWSIYDAYKVAQRINQEAMGQVMAATKPCPRCAERVMADAQVCRHCGHQFFAPMMPAPTPNVAQAAPLALPAAPPPEPPGSLFNPAPPPPVQQARFCSECGQSLRPTSKFCMNCGVPVVQSAETAPVSWPADNATGGNGA